ncbi:ABC transporter ATP-binding protein [Aquibium sp. ELW1220]|uniref:ABC transporter ATP-binding protein n=1 Tax=Aquibium sp. ELW1220 TaxID=2976766 RepID=UPI0025B0F7E8|nr:ABC transporter ATP-binding protein [Aquibium sp. ELW1220]MDN2584209.1 ABC transporter ATP-binding protein/permease [Aquibium sp. ELW1220]
MAVSKKGDDVGSGGAAASRPYAAPALAWKLMLDVLRGRVRSFVPSLVWMAVGAVATALLAWLMRALVNLVFEEPDFAAVWGIAAAVLAIFLVRAAAIYFEQTGLDAIKTRIVSDFQKRQFDVLVHSPLALFDKRSAAKAAGFTQHCARAAASAFMLITTNLIKNVLTLAALATVMVIQAPTLSAIALVVAPVAFFAIRSMAGRIRHIARQEAELTAGATAAFTDALSGIAVIKAFRLEPVMTKRIEAVVDQLERRSNKLNRAVAMSGPIMEGLGGMVIALLLVYAGWEALRLGRTPGEFAAFLTAFLLAYQPARRLAQFNLELSRQLVAVDAFYRLIETQDRETDVDGAPAEAMPPAAAIEFREVSFRYGRKLAGLRSVSFRIHAGSKVAIVGKSGSGKSTIARLLLRFAEPHGGAILVDDQPVAGLSRQVVRDMVSYVSQDVSIFDGTIAENIGFGRVGASEAEIHAVADAARVTEFAATLPEGLDTRLGSGAPTLSGGQRQRIAFARALLKDAPIMLFDEATSGLDSGTEFELQEASGLRNREKTVIVISHRLSTIRACDRIIVLDKGEVAGMGGHDDLLVNCPAYRRGFGSQSGLPEAGDG